MGNPLNTAAGIMTGTPAVGDILNKSGAGQSGGSNGQPATISQQPVPTDIFSQYAKSLPSAWNQSAPINNPSDILNAYMANIDAINNSAQQQNIINTNNINKTTPNQLNSLDRGFSLKGFQ